MCIRNVLIPKTETEATDAQANSLSRVVLLVGNLLVTPANATDPLPEPSATSVPADAGPSTAAPTSTSTPTDAPNVGDSPSLSQSSGDAVENLQSVASLNATLAKQDDELHRRADAPLDFTKSKSGMLKIGTVSTQGGPSCNETNSYKCLQFTHPDTYYKGDYNGTSCRPTGVVKELATAGQGFLINSDKTPPPVHNCTCYVAYRLVAAGRFSSAYIDNLSYAGDWNNAVAKFSTVRVFPQARAIAPHPNNPNVDVESVIDTAEQPQKGDVAQWTTNNHVAMIDAITLKPDSLLVDAITISEDTYNLKTTRTHTIVRTVLAGNKHYWPNNLLRFNRIYNGSPMEGSGVSLISGSNSSSSPAAPTYALTYNLNGGTTTLPTRQTYTAGSRVSLPPASSVSRPGYRLTGWYYNGTPARTIEAGGSYTMPAFDVSFTAVWQQTAFSVTFNLNSGYPTSGVSFNLSNLSATSYFALPAASEVTRYGYSLNGWIESGITYSPGVSFRIDSRDRYFTASWSLLPPPVPWYTVSFNLNGGTGTLPANISARAGQTVPIPSTDLARTGYTFGGWLLGSTWVGSGFVMPAYNVVLYASWERIPTPPPVVVKPPVTSPPVTVTPPPTTTKPPSSSLPPGCTPQRPWMCGKSVKGQVDTNG